MFDRYLDLWGLVPDGGPILTASGGLLPVVWHARPAMLKVATCDEERRGNALMAWWNGQGAAQVWQHDGDAILLERAQPAPSLAVARLHAHRAPLVPPVVPLHDWFYALLSNDADNDALRRSAAIARQLLAGPSVDEVMLHGDIHHGNILHFGDRGWRAIDPKGLRGERTFDYANLFCNPVHDIAVDPVRFERRIAVVADAASLDRRRLLQWILAWSGLSAVWLMEDELPADTRLAVAMLAAGALGL
jgi:streptomycin 6-kinase